MAKSMMIAAICVALGLIPMDAQSHVAEPAVNFGDTSFLDGIGGPGLLVEEIGDGSHSGKVEGIEGHAIPGAPAINSLSGLTHIAWLSNRRLIGGWYGVEVVGVAAHVNAGASGTAAGCVDTTVSPFILQWNEQNVGNVRIDQGVVLDFDLPTGEYQRDSNVNLNIHAITVDPYYAITAFPQKILQTSWTDSLSVEWIERCTSFRHAESLNASRPRFPSLGAPGSVQAYSQPRSRAIRAASTRLAAPSLAMASER